MPHELVDALDHAGEQVLPFVGAGLAIAAGVPAGNAFAIQVARRVGLPVAPGDDSTLGAVTQRLTAEHGRLAARKTVAETISSLPVVGTAVLRALAGNPSRIVVTTNYDDAIERSAHQRGLTAIPLLPDQAGALRRPDRGVVHVVHLHGLAARPETLVLPGLDTFAQTGDTPLALTARSLFAQHLVLYVGFSLGAEEVHLRSLIGWLAANISGTRGHVLLMPGRQAAQRASGLAALAPAALRVIAYDDPDHSTVEQAALWLAPSPDPAGASAPPLADDFAEIWVQPAMIAPREGDDLDRLESRIFGAEEGLGEPLVTPEELFERRRALVVAAPGMGKTELLFQLAAREERAPTLLVELKALGVREPHAPELAVARLLAGARAGREGVPLPDIEALEHTSYLMLFDGLDEVPADRREDAVEALEHAVERWPQHRWVVATRPTAPAVALLRAGFAQLRILPSQAWARAYLRAHSVPEPRVEQALLASSLGSLLGVPLFAALLAQRLRDGSDLPPRPLDLIVDAHHAAIAREARRHAARPGDLGHWTASLAVALELRGRTEAAVDELGGVPGAEGLGPEEARRRLVEASLLADLPDRAAFPRRTLQEALCAAAILAAPDPVAALRSAAVARVGDEEVLREDTEFTLDLVFENADRTTRRRLRALDERRWARTVISRGDASDAGEAFDLLWCWYERRRLGFGWLADGLLRTDRGAMIALATRFPGVVERRRPELLAALASHDGSARDRALVVLAHLPRDVTTSTCLLPLLTDANELVAARAAAAAAHLGIREAVPALTAKLGARNPRVRTGALSALVELVDGDELVRLVAATAGHNVLRPIAQRLRERLGVDDQLALLAERLDDRSTWAWLLERLTDEDSPVEWTPSRIEALAHAVIAGGPHSEELEQAPRVPTLLAAQPDAALAGARRALDTWRSVLHDGPSVLRGVDSGLLALDVNEQVQRAVEQQRERDAERDERTRRFAPQAAVDALAARLDAGELREDRVWVSDLQWPVRQLEDRHRARLAELVEAWWPERPLREISLFSDEPGHETAIAAVTAGASLGLPLPAERWLDLLAAGQLLEFADNLVGWLISTYRPEYEPAVIELVSSIEKGMHLSCVIAAVGRQRLTPPVVDALVARLDEIADQEGGWANAVGLLVEDGQLVAVRRLLTPRRSGKGRAAVVHRLAEAGDAEARIEVLTSLIADARKGRGPGDLHWRAAVYDDRVTQALGVLADLQMGDDRMNKNRDSFAVGQLGMGRTPATLRVLDELVRFHGETHPGLELTRERVARYLATDLVLARLPEDLAEVAIVLQQVAAVPLPEPARNET